MNHFIYKFVFYWFKDERLLIMNVLTLNVKCSLITLNKYANDNFSQASIISYSIGEALTLKYCIITDTMLMLFFGFGMLG